MDREHQLAEHGSGQFLSHLCARSDDEARNRIRSRRASTGGYSRWVDVFQSSALSAQSSNPKGIDMSKGQQRGNRESKKPKKEKTKVIAAAPSRKAAAPPFVPASDPAFRSHKSRG